MQAHTFDRSLYLALHRLGVMGTSERRVLASLIRPGMTVVDVGANIGLYSVHLARLVGPSGRVISFEPDPELVECLRVNCAANAVSNVTVNPCALGSAPGRLVLSRLTLNSGDNHLGTAGDPTFRRPVEVEVVPLDVREPGLRPDFVKIDVQGWELNVLKGMEGILRAAPRVGIFLEICPKWLRRAGDSPEELYDFLAGLGMRVFALDTQDELGRQAFLEMAGRLKGQDYVDVFVSREAMPVT